MQRATDQVVDLTAAKRKLTVEKDHALDDTKSLASELSNVKCIQIHKYINQEFIKFDLYHCL